MLDIHFVCSSVTPINLVFTTSHAEKKTELTLLLLISDYPLCIYCNFYFISFFFKLFIYFLDPTNAPNQSTDIMLRLIWQRDWNEERYVS